MIGLLCVSTSVALVQWSPRLGCASPRLAASIRMQQGPLEDGYGELLPLINSDDGNVDPKLVERVDEEVRELTGVSLEELLNPSKVVNLERERLVALSELSLANDAEMRAELDTKLAKIENDLYREKRTVFRGWLKNLFIGQSVLAVAGSGFLVFDALPGISVDLSLRALGFWSYWLFVIPSLRARRPSGWEKKALNFAFLGSPILTLGLPFVTKEPALIWEANLALLVACYVWAYFTGDEDEQVAGFSGVLRWLDFGSGQERGMSATQREKLRQKQQEE